MFIKSKYDSNQVINTFYLMTLTKLNSGNAIYFQMMDNLSGSWGYDSEEDRDREYEWIMSILDYKQNEHNEKTEDYIPYEGDYDKLGNKLSE